MTDPTRQPVRTAEELGDRSAHTSVPLHPLLAARWSPRAFDSTYVLADAQLTALLEAARWSPSSGNTQPWRFLVGRRGDETFTAIGSVLNRGNKTWTPSASALILGLYERGGDRPLSHGQYDLGQAFAHLTFQAAHLGLIVHQMSGFDPAAARTTFAIPDGPDGFVPHVVVAVGRLGDHGDLDEGLRAKDLRTRIRRPLDESAFSAWGTPLHLGEYPD